MISTLRKKRYRQRQNFPQHILFYRDGVSESQYGMIYLDELPQAEAGCLAFGEAKGQKAPYKPKITMLVVGKRHHTRFYPKENAPAQAKMTNLQAGLIIDHTVVTPQYHDFYLQSHDCPEGTARAGHYVVIVNESWYTPRMLHDTVNFSFSHHNE
jgi:hypothetical protein